MDLVGGKSTSSKQNMREKEYSPDDLSQVATAEVTQSTEALNGKAVDFWSAQMGLSIDTPSYVEANEEFTGT